jgi:predicted phage tail protein
MKVEIFHTVNEHDRFDFAVSSIREVLNALSLHCGAHYVDTLVNEQYKFVLFTEDGSKPALYLRPEVALSDFSGYDNLLLIADLQGETGVEIAMAIGGALTTTVTTAAGTTAVVLTTLGTVVAAVINVAIAVGIGLAMQALSPTAEFSSDPAEAQSKQSSLFNGAPIIREQGGSVPLVYGNPYCGGVLIASSITTAEDD